MNLPTNDIYKHHSTASLHSIQPTCILHLASHQQALPLPDREDYKFLFSPKIDIRTGPIEKQYTDFILEYQNQSRSSGISTYPTIYNDSLSEGLSVLLYIPQTEIDSILYDIILTAPSSDVIPIASGINHKMSDVDSDTL